MNRRDSLKLAGTAVAGLAASRLLATATAQAQTAQTAMPSGPFKLPALGYGYDALEPYIDAMTMNIHHTRHHQAFITNLNLLVGRWLELATMAPEAILGDLGKAPEAVRTAVRNNLGGHWNHSFFWDLMTPGGSKKPTGDLKAAIERTFGGHTPFAEKFNAAGLGRFGSGWAWLVVTRDKMLDIVNTPNQDPPIIDGGRAIIGVDVWEHAYYLKYQNRRGDYLKSWWNTVNWDKAMNHFRKAMI
jgi:Fe-Mn family superoxide dismutase